MNKVEMAIGSEVIRHPDLERKRPRLKRFFDVILGSVLIVLASPLFVALGIAIKVTSRGSILHWSKRVGQYDATFRMPKFRSMRMETPQLATHLLQESSRYLTPIGSFLRKTSLDELPQLFSILGGQLSFVGPRPALFNQDDLVALRAEYGINNLVPGLTGWAQVNGRDELSIPEKVRLEREYLGRQSFLFDLKILWLTFWKVIRRDGVSH